MLNVAKDVPVSFGKDYNEELNTRISTFSKALFESADYYKTNRNATKPFDNITLGKKAEFFAAKAFWLYYGFPKLEPDLEVYKNKSFAADLPYIGFPSVHVKCCNKTTYKFCKDYSWTFQYSNGTDSLFKHLSAKDLICGIYLESAEQGNAIIKFIKPWYELHIYLKDPIKPELIGIKKVIYYKDLTLQRQIFVI